MSAFDSIVIRDTLSGLIIWAVSVIWLLFFRPNYDGFSPYEIIYSATYNASVGWFIGLYLLDRVPRDGFMLFAVRSCAVLILGVLINEAMVEPYVFKDGPLNWEGIYWGIADPLTPLGLFLLLRIVRRPCEFEQFAEMDSRDDARKPINVDAECIFVRIAGETRRILVGDVLYLEAERDFTRIVCRNGEHFVSESLKSLLERSEQLGLARIHKSFAVNLARVEWLTRTEVSLGDRRVPVGRKYWEAFAEKWKAQSSALAVQPARSCP